VKELQMILKDLFGLNLVINASFNQNSDTNPLMKDKWFCKVVVLFAELKLVSKELVLSLVATFYHIR